MLGDATHKNNPKKGSKKKMKFVLCKNLLNRFFKCFCKSVINVLSEKHFRPRRRLKNEHKLNTVKHILGARKTRKVETGCMMTSNDKENIKIKISLR